MAEREFQLEPYGVEWVCDACGIGTLQVGGPISSVMRGGGILHSCTQCDDRRVLPEPYPLVRHRRVPE
jgi:hypothetical protein